MPVHGGHTPNDIACPFAMGHCCAMSRFCPIALLMLGPIAGCSEPPKTYAASCSVPPGHWGERRIAHLRAVQPVYVGPDGALLWNRSVITDAVLRRHMMQASAMDPAPQVVLQVAPTAPCDRVRAVRSIMDDAPLCKGPHSLCSEGSAWKRWPVDAGA